MCFMVSTIMGKQKNISKTVAKSHCLQLIGLHCLALLDSIYIVKINISVREGHGNL